MSLKKNLLSAQCQQFKLQTIRTAFGHLCAKDSRKSSIQLWLPYELDSNFELIFTICIYLVGLANNETIRKFLKIYII